VTYYLHETPGRLRVRSPLLKQNPAEAQRAIGVLSKLRGITKITTSPTTGSLTIRYCPKTVCPATIINSLSKHKFIYGITALPRRSHHLQKQRPRPTERPRRLDVPRDLRLLHDQPLKNAQILRSEPIIQLSPRSKKLLGAAAKIILPILAERAFGKTGREIVSALL
jgi:hypothetical protein